MSKSYKLKSSASRAAKRKLGKEAKIDVDFLINKNEEGFFSWQPISKEPKKQKEKLSMRKTTLQMMLDGEDDDSILSHIKTHYPSKKYDSSHVKWYRSYFSKNDMIPPKFAPKRSKLYKDFVNNSVK